MPDSTLPEGGEVIERTDGQLCDVLRENPPGSWASRSAYAELYVRHYNAAMATAFRLVNDRYHAEEVVSEAFTKTLRALNTGAGPTDTFRGYLLTAVKSEVYRTPAIERVTDGMDVPRLETIADLSIDDPLVSFAERDQLVRSFTTLPEQWRVVLYLLEVEGLSSSRVAELLKMTPAAVWSLAFRAREGLRAAYLQQYVQTAKPECVGHARHLAGYVRGGLRKRKAGRVRAHVDECDECATQMTRLAGINQRLSAWLAPVMLASGLAAAAFGAPESASAAPSSSPVTKKVTAGSAVALVLAGAAVAVALLLSPQTAGPPAPVTEQPMTVENPVTPADDEPDEGILAPDAESGEAQPPPAGDGAPSQDEVPQRERPSGDDFTPNWIVVDE